MAFFKGILLGLTLQISVGPVFFTVLHKAVTEGSREALKMTFGAAVVDAIYIAVSFTGIAVLLQIKILQGVVLGAGAAILFFFGFRYWQKARNSLRRGDAERSMKIFSGSSFVYGLKLTAVNPLTVIFWSGTFGALLASGILNGPAEAVLYAAGCVTATIIFLSSTCFLGRFLPSARGNRITAILDRVAGLVLMIFSCMMVLKLLDLLAA